MLEDAGAYRRQQSSKWNESKSMVRISIMPELHRYKNPINAALALLRSLPSIYFHYIYLTAVCGMHQYLLAQNKLHLKLKCFYTVALDKILICPRMCLLKLVTTPTRTAKITLIIWEHWRSTISVFLVTLFPKGKNMWKGLGLNPGLLALLAIAQTSRPRLQS